MLQKTIGQLVNYFVIPKINSEFKHSVTFSYIVTTQNMEPPGYLFLLLMASTLLIQL